ncbi:MAG: mannose-1-phosphate guanylyltransferase/mannose-6-phosphate isomerase [Burkholderiales bacterium]
MLIPMILSGGSGTRLWPVSREAYPKPFIKLQDGTSLLQKTVQRLSEVQGVQDILTVTNHEHFFITRDEYRGAGFPAKHFFVLEPCARNTAPAIAMGALCAKARYGEDAILLVLPADHLVHDKAAFAAAVEQAQRLASEGYLVTFGIPPTRPDTGFGYIERGEKLSGGTGWEVARFTEKPDEATARDMVASGKFLWNSGMFCFRASTFLEELGQSSPEVLASAQACWAAAKEKGDHVKLDPELFGKMTDISVDYAVMEKSRKVALVPAGFDWSDVGSWTAISDLTEADARGNRVQGPAVLVNSRNCYVQSAERMVAAVGVENLLIVDTPDALLVVHEDHVQDVKKVAQQLKLAKHESYRLHKTVHRPWGSYTVLEEGEGFKMKRIVVKPGASLSLQMHYHRSEHWIVVSGTAKVVNGERDLLVRTNESTYIPAGNKHRLENPGKVDLVMIEVQSGNYLEEDDIVRFEDKYGRET